MIHYLFPGEQFEQILLRVKLNYCFGKKYLSMLIILATQMTILIINVFNIFLSIKMELIFKTFFAFNHNLLH